MDSQLYQGDGPFAPRETTARTTGRNICPTEVDTHKREENMSQCTKPAKIVKNKSDFSFRQNSSFDPILCEGVLQVSLPVNVCYSKHNESLKMEIKPRIQEKTPPKKSCCSLCRYHWCSIPQCPHTCVHQIDASSKENPTCVGHWFIQLKPTEPTKPSLCPTNPCSMESEEDQKQVYTLPTISQSNCKSDNEIRKKPHHDSCWCNGWNQINQPSDINPNVTENCRKRKKRNPVISDCKMKAILDRQKREKEFPPPPPDVSSYKPVVFELKAPTAEETNWIAIPQPCVKIATLEEQSEPCKRENCLHSTPQSTCLYDEPCKAHCFNHPPGLKPHKYPLGYPNKEQC